MAALFVGACATTIPPHGSREQETRQPPEQTGGVEAIPLQGTEVEAGPAVTEQPKNIDASVAADLRAALSSVPPYRQAAYLDAARKLVDAKRLQDAQTVLDGIDTSGLTPMLDTRKRLLEAEIYFQTDNLDRALRLVEPGLRAGNVDPGYTARELDLKARIELRKGHPLEAAKTWIKRDNYLADATALEENHRRIWYALGYLNDLHLQLAESGGIDDDLRGWLDLAILFLEFEGDSHGLRTAVSQWSNANPSHPAAGFAAALLGPPRALDIRQIALLLPLSSNYGAAAQTVHNGFDAAHGTDSDPGRPHVIFYDVGSEPSLAANYVGVAASEGADVIVGPLGKSAVNALIESRQPSKPTVLLGSVSDDHSSGPPVYQFDLAPDPEARQVAEFMYASGRRRIAALYPQDEWGQRVFNAFASRWKALGGTLADAEPYSPAADDFSAPIKKLFDLTQSDNRRAFLQAKTGLNLKFEARRRQDIDALFLAARPGEARLIKPQINFYQGLDLPVYSTSSVYSGTPDSRKDTDLDGIIFPGMPWLLNNTARMHVLKSRLENAGYSNVSTGLFAFGYDAYRLGLLVADPALTPGTRIAGMTSDLVIGEDGRIHRRLEWARFIDGVPVRIWDH